MKLFTFPLIVTGLVLAGAAIWGGASVAFTLATLCILEVSLSFDNAVINALWLKRMSPFWQKMFLTVGILIAVFAMRLVFPLLVVAIAGGISIQKTLDLAINNPDEYSRVLHGAHHDISTFGAVFLGMIFLDWITEDRELRWLGPIENFMARVGKLDVASVVIMLVLLVLLAGHNLLAGVLGLVTYLVVNMVAAYFEEQNEEPDEDKVVELNTGYNPATVAKGGIGAFLYLELMDASFSFDGVMAAFAISKEVFIIALGLGVGALFIRTMTVYLVRNGVLDEMVHLEHGAHYAIGALAVVLFVSLRHDVPEAVSAGVSLAAIGAALITSLRHNKREKEPVPVT